MSPQAEVDLRRWVKAWLACKWWEFGRRSTLALLIVSKLNWELNHVGHDQKYDDS